MQNQNNNCSFKNHKDTEAKSFCFKCQIYLCNKCINSHAGLFDDHPIYNLDKIAQSFSGFCKEENHNIKLNYFCKNHNQLCCGLCVSKINGKGNGKHSNCDICFIEDIKEEKKSKLTNNIKTLEDLSNKLEETIKNLKAIFEKINESKENIKSDIQKTFTKIRTELNYREDILLLEVDKYFDNNFFDEDIIKKSEKLPSQIKTSLEKGKLIENEWKNEDELNILINDCINIENNLKDINNINDSVKKYNQNNKKNYRFFAYEDDFILKIKNLGSLSYIDSLILNNDDTYNKFHLLIDDHNLTNNMNLIYRSSRDGFNYLSIVNKINNKSNLIFLYLTGNDRIFGTYIKAKLENIDLNGSRKYYTDENAFTFSLNNNKKYKILVPGNAIGLDSTYYIIIGNNGNSNGFFYYQNIIYDQQLINTNRIYDFQNNSELTGGEGNLKELEIFEII